MRYKLKAFFLGLVEHNKPFVTDCGIYSVYHNAGCKLRSIFNV